MKSINMDSLRVERSSSHLSHSVWWHYLKDKGLKKAEKATDIKHEKILTLLFRFALDLSPNHGHLTVLDSVLRKSSLNKQ
jgi:hypothetical protein